MKHICLTNRMKFVEIPQGSFDMGQEESSEENEKPVHHVVLSHNFYISMTQVTNKQYELFDPQHKVFRGKMGLSTRDDEPVVFVNWYDAKAYCKWLSDKEGKTYRLPTEAEWEYCCRAGTTSLYTTGDQLPEVYYKRQEDARELEEIDLTVAHTPPNAYGLYDMHGNVEEWCEDWYGNYGDATKTNPTGCPEGDLKVTRGGSHHTSVEYLRSAKRHAALPEDRSCFIGFRIVQSEEVGIPYKVENTPKVWAQHVRQLGYKWQVKEVAYFEGPKVYIHRPSNAFKIPMYSHNHCPSITWCGNGDLLVNWFSCEKESGREMTLLAARKRVGKTEFDSPSEFFKVPDRNMTGTSLFNDGNGTIFHFNGVSQAAEWAYLAITMRKSQDNGLTWSNPVYINAEHQYRNQVISGTIVTNEGKFIQPCDANPAGAGGTAVHISSDGGLTWVDPGKDEKIHAFYNGAIGKTIAGIHAGVACLEDGTLIALGRGDDIEGTMPKSISLDQGQTWRYSASGLPPVSGGQRLVLKRLNEGPLLLISFTDSREQYLNFKEEKSKLKGIQGKDAYGNDGTIYGMYAAISYDGGKNWPIKKIIASGEEKEVEGGAWTGTFKTNHCFAEPMGYLAITQTPDNQLHLVSSLQYYTFNLKWLES